MVIETTTPETPPFKWRHSVYIYVDRHMRYTASRSYAVGPAKARFTREYDVNGRFRAPWTAGNGEPMLQETSQRWMNNDLIFKLDPVENAGWVCIFDPQSQAGEEYCQGNLTTKELRDLIPW